jgi:hypothetical protein
LATGLQAQSTYRSSGKPKYNSNKKKKNEETFVQKLIFGGGIGLAFGDYTNISVTPVIGYRITDNFSAGIGFGYQYVKIKNFFEVEDPNSPGFYDYYDLKANLFSASIWARYIVWRNLFAHAELEQNYMSFKSPGYDPNGSGNIIETTDKYQAPCLLLGGGYRQPMGDRASVNFTLLYDVLQDTYSPYGNQPFIRIQFLAGF